MARKPTSPKTVEALKHDEATRKNIPTAEYQSVMQKEERAPVRVTYPRGSNGLEGEKEQRNRDLDPQLVWRGKDQQDWSDLVVNAPPLYIQEKVHPKVLIDDLRKQSEQAKGVKEAAAAGYAPDLFADFNGLPDDNAKTEFYQHDAHWANRMILGDSLQVMASLAEREGLRGKVQCIYFDPPYGIKFNSNFQWSTTSRAVKDGNTDHITREPEQVTQSMSRSWNERLRTRGKSGPSSCTPRNANGWSVTTAARRAFPDRLAPERPSSRFTALCIWRERTRNRAYCSRPSLTRLPDRCTPNFAA
jgi:adenine-specific DNA-methyltransferase